jgi:hypothetical protein
MTIGGAATLLNAASEPHRAASNRQTKSNDVLMDREITTAWE